MSIVVEDDKISIKGEELDLLRLSSLNRHWRDC